MATIRLRIIGWAAIVIVVCLTVVIADRTLGFYRNREKPVPTRYLRFREWEPGRVWNGPPWNLEHT